VIIQQKPKFGSRKHNIWQGDLVKGERPCDIKTLRVSGPSDILIWVDLTEDDVRSLRQDLNVDEINCDRRKLETAAYVQRVRSDGS
jgi:hypothetical protein